MHVDRHVSRFASCNGVGERNLVAGASHTALVCQLLTACGPLHTEENRNINCRLVPFLVCTRLSPLAFVQKKYTDRSRLVSFGCQ